MGITNPAEEYFKDGVWGWDGTVWHKLGLIWGYSAAWAEDLSVAMTSDASFVGDSGVVLADEVWIIQHAAFANHTGARGMARIWLMGSAHQTPLVWTLTPARYEPVVWSGAVTLTVGDYIRMEQQSCLTNDVIYAGVWGYKMKIAE